MKVLIPLCLLVAGCANPLSPTATISLQLTVRDEITHDVVPNGHATINGQRYTILRGTADLPVVANAPLSIRVEAHGYAPVWDTLTFTDRTAGRSLSHASWTFYLRK